MTMRTLAASFVLACAAATAAAQPVGAHSDEIVEVPVWLTTAPGSYDLTRAEFELRVNGKPQPIDFFEVWDESDYGVTCLLGFRRIDDDAGRVEVTAGGEPVRSIRWRSRFGPALHDHYDGLLLGVTWRDGVETSGVPLELRVSPGYEGAELAVAFPRHATEQPLPARRDHGEGLYVCIINEWGDRMAFEQRQLLFDPLDSGRTGFSEWYRLPQGHYIARAFMTLHDTVIGFTRTEFTVR
jgi:hypothetical protein